MENDVRKQTGDRLRAFAERYGGPSGLAKAIGISPQALNDYLIGRRRPGPKMVDRLVKIGCDPVLLLTGNTVEETNKKYLENVERNFEIRFPMRFAGLLEFEKHFGSMSVERVNEVRYYYRLAKEMESGFKVAETSKMKYKTKKN